MTTPFGSFVDSARGSLVLPLRRAGRLQRRQAPVGTGPFVYQSFTAGERSVFIKNKNYWKPGCLISTPLTFIDFSDNAAVQDALVTGTIQAAGQLDPPQIPALANTNGVRTVASRPGSSSPSPCASTSAPFNDVDVRQAMRLLVDRQQMIDSALDGYGVVASDVFAPYDPDFDASLHRQQDISQAKFLLKQSGHEELDRDAHHVGSRHRHGGDGDRAGGAGRGRGRHDQPSRRSTRRLLRHATTCSGPSRRTITATLPTSARCPSPSWAIRRRSTRRNLTTPTTPACTTANATADPAKRKQILYEMQKATLHPAATPASSLSPPSRRASAAAILTSALDNDLSRVAQFAQPADAITDAEAEQQATSEFNTVATRPAALFNARCRIAVARRSPEQAPSRCFERSPIATDPTS